MGSAPPLEIDINELWEKMRPPSVPDEAFARDNPALQAICSWRKSHAVALLAGLQTDPDFHANGVRLDWLQRLILSKSQGRRKPRRRELSTALNAGLDRARVLRLEDPIEDSFCDLLPTSRGNFRILSGQWENTGPYTETLLRAFESLPDSQTKRQVLESGYALLSLSDAVAERSGIDRFSSSSGQPMGKVALPRIDNLKRFAARVRFSDKDLTQLDVNPDALSPFLLESQLFQYISDRDPGETPLEFHPLLPMAKDILIASPVNISIAVRSILIYAAKKGGMDRALLEAMLIEQARYSELSGFWPVPRLELSRPNRHFMRGAICRFGEGRFLQIIQVPTTFNHFPERAFAWVRDLGEEASQFIADDVKRFWQLLKEQSEWRQAVTVPLLSGWGTPHRVAPPIDQAQAPENWEFLPLSFSDATTLGACENGKFRDICRILEQVRKLEAEGYSFHYVNGILNLFGFWRTTGGNLIPEHIREIEPPCNISIPTNELLAPRLEAARKRDAQALPMPGGHFKTVQRIEWSDDDDLLPLYASVDDAMAGRLLGAAAFRERTWWVECLPESDESRDWCYRIWQALTQWLVAIGERIALDYPDIFSVGAYVVRFAVPVNSAFERKDCSRFNSAPLADTVTAETDGAGARRVMISPAWRQYLWNADNDAEVELVATILEQIAVGRIGRDDLRQAVHRAIGSSDWRWLHARPLLRPVDLMESTQLVGRFREIGLSAVSLAKCGSVWRFRDRSEGTEIEGEDDCKAFLTRYRDAALDDLIALIRRYDRQNLICLAADSYQAARLEQSSWRATIRALRAIHGTSADAKAFQRQNSINAVQRASKSICEIAACETPESGGLIPGPIDLEEMFAYALLLFDNGQLFASIRGGLLKPQLRISQAGDLLSDRSVFDVTLRPGAEWTNARALNESADAYRRERKEDESAARSERGALPTDLRSAIEAEYGVEADAFLDLQYAIIQMAELKGRSVFTARLSELAQALRSNPDYPSNDPLPLLMRLTLTRRQSWRDRSSGLSESDIDLGRFDRPFSVINRPLVALDDEHEDPIVLAAPLFVSDGTMYSLSGLMKGDLQNRFWVSPEARRYAGARADAAGKEFERKVADRLRELGLQAWCGRKLSWALNEKVDDELGNIDVLAINRERNRVWVIEAKNLRLCRTEAEVASRLSEFRGRMVPDKHGGEKPDKMLRHLRRVQYLRERNDALCERLSLSKPPEVRGVLVVDSPQPMNFYMLEDIPDAESVLLDLIDKFAF